MRIGSLFSGAGGLDLAVQAVFGGEVVWHSEIDPAASKVLAHRWPDTPNIGDITCIDWDVWPEICPEVVVPVDVLCGGWPCQPFSIAGRKKGIHDERALWPYVAATIRALRPHYIVLENVPRVLAAGEFDRVAADLAQAGYDFAWLCLRASDIGAPHNRERLFILAAPTDTTVTGLQGTQLQRRRHEPPGQCVRQTGDTKLLPTPAAADSARGPDYARAGRRRSGTDDLVTVCARTSRDNQWSVYADAVEHWEHVTTLTAPKPYEPNRNGNPRLNPAFSEWMMGWPTEHVTSPDIGLMRRDQLRIIGNGVVPQQAEHAIRILLDLAGPLRAQGKADLTGKPPRPGPASQPQPTGGTK